MHKHMLAKGPSRSSSSLFLGSAYLVDVLALELAEELVEALVIGRDSDGVENLLDVGSRRGGVAGKAEEQVGCDVLHFELFAMRPSC